MKVPVKVKCSHCGLGIKKELNVIQGQKVTHICPDCGTKTEFTVTNPEIFKKGKSKDIARVPRRLE